VQNTLIFNNATNVYYIILPLLLEYGLQDVHKIIMLGTTVVFSEISSRAMVCANLLGHMKQQSDQEVKEYKHQSYCSEANSHPDIVYRYR
jgi:hypothetical protein